MFDEYVVKLTASYSDNSFTISNQKANKPIVSNKGGIYNSSQIIQFYSYDSNYVVRYTLDGSAPTHESKIYSDALLLDSTSVVIARGFVNDHLPRDPVYNTYIIK